MNANNFKTQLCQHWQRTGGNCPYGDNCLFAHGVEDLRSADSKFARPQPQNVHHPLFKTEICRFVLTNSQCPYSAARMCQFLHPGDEGFDEKMRAHETVLASKPPPQPTLESFFKSRLSRKSTEKKVKSVWGTDIYLPVGQESKLVEGDVAQVRTESAKEPKKPKQPHPKPECKSAESDLGADPAIAKKKDIRKIRKKLRRIEQYKGRDGLSVDQQELVRSEPRLQNQLNKLLKTEEAAASSKEIWEQTQEPDKEVWERAETPAKSDGEIWERALNTLRLGARYPTPSVLSNLRA